MKLCPHLLPQPLVHASWLGMSYKCLKITTLHTRLALSWLISGPHLQPAHPWVSCLASPELSCLLPAVFLAQLVRRQEVPAMKGPQEPRCSVLLPPSSLSFSGSQSPLSCSMRALLLSEEVFLLLPDTLVEDPRTSLESRTKKSHSLTLICLTHEEANKA